MAGLMSALNTVAQLATAVNDSDAGATKAVLDALNSKEMALARSGGSIMKLLGNYIIEPVALVSDTLKNEEVIEQLLETNVDIFASFYLQAFEILRTMYGLQDSAVFELLGTDNGGLERVMLKGASKALSNEGRDYLKEVLLDEINLSTEADTRQHKRSENKEITVSAIIQKELEITIKFTRSTRETKNKIKTDNHGSMTSRDEAIRAGTYNKQNDHHFSSEREIKDIQAIEYVVIPVLIKAHVIFTPFENILNMLKPNARDKSFANRLDDYRSGAVSLLDFIFTGDLIKEYKKNKLKDKDGLLKMLNDRTLSANSKLATQKIIGFEKYYNIMVISNDEKHIVENHLGGSVNKSKYKERLLEESNSLMLNIMDVDYERVTLYTKDIRGKSDITYKALSKRKGENNDYGELVKAVMGNKPVVF